MRLLVSALEPSSNLHLREVLKHTHDIELVGIFEASLGTPHVDISQNAVMGIVDTLRKYFWFRRLVGEMVELAHGCDKVLLMDGSGFNLPLAQKIKAKYPDKEIIYYILPQIWASRPKRVAKIEQSCDRLLGILPFEIDNYPSKKALFVGHPLLDELDFTPIPKEQTLHETIAYLPGSRRSEITRLMPHFRDVRRSLGEHRATLVIPPHFTPQKIEEYYGDIEGFEVSHSTPQSLKISDFAYICSGTATLEAGLLGTPFVLAYKTSPLNYYLIKAILNIKQLGLANLILERKDGSTLHQELIQNEVTLENLINAHEGFDKKLFGQKASELKSYLAHGSSQKVAQIIMGEG